ncbi:flagellar M-ring protein FliF [Oscillospiraceae bacterium OttesenSCG-928-F05]|nr:flagellar M-ring protein FliF [Oscillospiraceae bacterium OttesenSCG-928-F05]
MQETIRKIVKTIGDKWDAIDKKARIRLLIIAGVILVAIIIAAVILTRTTYAVLYSDLSAAEAGEITSVLQAQGVKVQTRGTSTILVPEDDVSKLSMDLATQGYPKSGFTYDIYGQASGFGMTDAEKDTYRIFQYEDRLQNAIALNENIVQAVVTLNVPQKDKAIFASEVAVPSASVVVEMRNGATLSTENVKAIENLVSSAIEGLTADNVSITDTSLRRLNQRDYNEMTTLENNLEYERELRNELRRQVSDLLTPVYGSANVQVGISVEVDFDKKQEEEIVFSPVVDDEGIAVSMHEAIEKATGQTGVGDVVGTDPNGASPTYPELNGATITDYSNIVRDINYEVNELHRVIERAQGKITRLSVSVVVNNNDLPEEAQDADVIRDIVAGTLGLVGETPDEALMDLNHIRVQFMPFTEDQNASRIRYYDYQQTLALFELIKNIFLAAIIVFGVLFIVLYIFRVFRRQKEEERAAAQRAAAEALIAEGGMPDGEGADGIEILKSPVREQLEGFIAQNPQEAANLLRNWFED